MVLFFSFFALAITLICLRDYRGRKDCLKECRIANELWDYNMKLRIDIVNKWADQDYKKMLAKRYDI